MKSRSLFRAAGDLARAGNFPSVASNVLAALVLGATAREGAGLAAQFPAPGTLALAVLAGVLIYAGGATFNDVFDAEFDARRRPERAIPSGAISRTAAGWLAAAEMLAGLGLLVFLGASPTMAVVLAATILAYDWIHKRWVGSVVLMALCRVYLAWSVVTLPGLAKTPAWWAWVTALFVYIVTLSLLARSEYKPGAPAAKLGRAVGRLLAFIPLVDAVALLAAGAWLPALACAAAVPLGRWAQRLAAST
jgi:4-hydroxybenzoate polyprenyltransferase